MSSSYDSIRSAVLKSGSDARVEVNQRALIDKILARYASAGAVYRELLQNSNDACARTAEVRFSTEASPKGQVVTQVAYRNDGAPFREADWTRLRKIAEGNPDVSKVGAFGVGAYTMFSICEEPLVVSGGRAMAFAWRGDALWVRLAPSPAPPDKWTSFVLRSRDLYPVPDLVEFGQFLCASLTFTNSLTDIHVFVDDEKRLSISKRQVGEPTVVTPPKASSWWSGDGAVTTSRSRIFSLGRSDGSITETIIEMTVDIDGDTDKVRARYVSAIANTRVPADMARRMERVTKKRPPPEVKIEIFIDADSSLRSAAGNRKGPAAKITDAFSPRMGAGRVFIGFRTSQTTGLAAHLAAPLLPTVEREAIDFQDPTLRIYNCELLSMAGILMRLALEHSMSLVGERWVRTEPERIAFEQQQKKKTEANSRAGEQTNSTASEKPEKPNSSEASEERTPASSIFSFARFMSSGVKKIVDVIASVDFTRDDDEDLLKPADPRPLSREEQDAIILMRSFAPEQATPDARVGTVIATGFEMCFPGLSPPVLTNSGVVRGLDSRLPFQGIEGFVKRNVVRPVVLKNAENYLLHVAGCRLLSLQDLISHLKENAIDEDGVVRVLKWWTRYARISPKDLTQGLSLKQSISFVLTERDGKNLDQAEGQTKVPVVSLRSVVHYLDSSTFSAELPMPNSVLPKPVLEKLPSRLLEEKSLATWFSALPFQTWASYVCTHPCLTDGRAEDAQVRLRVLTTLSQEHARLSGELRGNMERFLHQRLSNSRCIPFDGQPESGFVTDFPKDLYLSSAELTIFNGLGSFKKVSTTLASAGVSDNFLLVLGVRETISMDFLFTQLDSLKWNRNPKPLISYLRTVSLTGEDLQKLRSTQYLPEVKDKTRTYAPSELYLPNPELDPFPFVKMLQWPSTELLHERSLDAIFLKRLGCHVDPPLENMIAYLKSDIKEDRLRQHGLNFIYKRLGTGGSYEGPYSNFVDVRFLPATAEDPLKRTGPRKELQAPNSCYSSADCSCLGFPILDLSQSKGARGYAEVFRCSSKPQADRLVHQLLMMVSEAKRTFSSREKDFTKDFNQRVLVAFTRIFEYMSSRAMELDKRMIDTLGRAPFIPHLAGESIQWYRPSQIYFENVNQDGSELTSQLFLVTKFSPFLATVGVKAEPSTEDLLRLLVSSPHTVLKKLGSESKYRSLLRRVAANTSRPITRQMRNSPFLLAFRLDEAEGQRGTDDVEDGEGSSVNSSTLSPSARYTLAKAEDICIIDNSYFSRLFNVLSAPPESDLERFYESLGSTYISKKVDQTFVAVGGQRSNTLLTDEFAKRIRERRPLLVSNIISRPLVSNATALLADEQLDIFEVSRVKALYTYRNAVKTQYVTCSASAVGKKRLSIFVTQNLDWFHVGNAIGSVILVRCNVQDAFFIGSLLEAPLSQLRARGFPVDRILRGAEPMEATVGSPVQHVRRPSRGRGADVPEDGGGFESILQQMFPDCSAAHIRKLLGPNPSLDSLRTAADTLADLHGKYPKDARKPVVPSADAENKVKSAPLDNHDAPKPPADQAKRSFSKRAGGSNVLSRAFRGLRGSSPAGTGLSGLKSNSPVRTPEGSTAPPGMMPSLPVQNPIRHMVETRDGASDRPPNDSASQKGLQGMLQKSVRSSRAVSAAGVSSPEHEVVSVPESLEKTAGACEVIPASELKPFEGPYRTGKTSTGIRVFASRNLEESKRFLGGNWEMVESFARVLIRLCSVYSLGEETVAIFHEPAGRTIAFNAGRALHFNIRFFASLHYKKGHAPGVDCYSFWFTTMAHELSHNLVIPHSQKHGYYTEAYVSNYMPKLLEVISRGA